jgi:hypothetical protein
MTFIAITNYHWVLCKCKTKYDTNFDAPDAHFDYLSLFSGTQAEKVGNLGEKCENCIRAEKNPTKQILCHEIEPNPSKDIAMHEGDNPSF